jgi:hypothetical protein
VVFALLLLFVVPVAVLIGSVRTIVTRLITEARSGIISWPTAPTAVVMMLCKYDLGFRCLLKLPKDTTSLELTRGGHRLNKRVTKGLKVSGA